MTLALILALLTTYYVDNTNVKASDSNAGTIALPWKTIGKGAMTAAAGDSVFVVAGSYNERVTPRASGTALKPIMFIGLGMPKVRAFTISATNYIVIDGLEITNTGLPGDSGAAIIVSNATGVQISNNSIHHTNGAGIAFGRTSFLKISGNQIHHTGITVFAGGGATALTSLYNQPSADVLIEQNSISYVSDYLNPFGSHYVFRNNTLGPSDPASAFHIDGMQNNAVASDSLMEGNLFVDNVSSDNHFFLNQIAGSTGWIVRFNTFLRSKGGLDWRSAGGHSFYNNTCFDAIGAGNRNNFQILATNSPANVVLNNIWVRCSSANPYSGAGYTKDYDLWFNGQGNPQEAHAINKDPMFVNATGGNLALKPGSPAINAGTYLTTVANSDTGSGPYIVVVNARPFQPGWAGARPDVIAVGNVGNITPVVAVNVTTNTITVAVNFVRHAGNGVWLKAKSDGVIVLHGATPDIGATEFAFGDPEDLAVDAR